jgi:predicted permease
MTGRTTVSVPVARAARAYGRALVLLPAGFRSEFERELLADFTALAEAAHARGGRLAVWAVLRRAMVDVAMRSMVERRWESSLGRRRAAHGGAGGPRRGGLDRMMDMLRELAQAGRGLVRRPAFSVVAALTLALGMGANVAIFSVVDAVLLRPLDYPESERMVVVRHHAPGLNLPELENSAGTLALYREFSQTLQSIAAASTQFRNLSGTDRPDRVEALAVSPSFFDVIAMRPAIGRPFDEQDAVTGSAPVAVLTHGTWQSRFGSDPSIVGTVIQLDGVSTEIVGVMPVNFRWSRADASILIPVVQEGPPVFGTFGTFGIARLAAGVTLEEATREVEALQARITERFPELTPEFFQQAGWSATVTPFKDLLVEPIRATLWVLFGTVGLVLIIAGANVANLFLVRAEARQREVAVRSALGAARTRLAFAFLSESIVLSLAGGIAGVLLAWGGVSLLVANGPQDLPRLHEVGMDGRVLGFAFVLCVIMALLLALVPLARYAGSSFASLLREGGRGNTAGRERHRARKALITGQVALALMLLVGAGLTLRSVARLRSIDPGFNVDGVLTVAVSFGNAERPRAISFYQRALDEIAAVPGASVVGASNSLPLYPRGYNGSSFTIESQPRADDALPVVAIYAVITPGFLEALGVPLLSGRAPERRDHEGGPPVIWVNETFVTSFLGGNNAGLGERVRFGVDTTFAEVVGVVGDIRTLGLREEIRPTAYMPMTTSNPTVSMEVMTFAIRTGRDPMSLVNPVRQAVQRVDPTVPITAARSMEDVLSASLASTAFTTTLLSIAALVALLLGVIGLYGVISYVVGQRTQEIGLRMALGARPGDVRSMVLRDGMGVTAIGVGLGLIGAAAASRLLETLLFGVSARDPLTFGGVAMLLTGVSIFATWLPARRAAAVDPLVALRTE